MAAAVLVDFLTEADRKVSWGLISRPVIHSRPSSPAIKLHYFWHSLRET